MFCFSALGNNRRHDVGRLLRGERHAIGVALHQGSSALLGQVQNPGSRVCRRKSCECNPATRRLQRPERPYRVRSGSTLRASGGALSEPTALRLRGRRHIPANKARHIRCLPCNLLEECPIGGGAGFTAWTRRRSEKVVLPGERRSSPRRSPWAGWSGATRNRTASAGCTDDHQSRRSTSGARSPVRLVCSAMYTWTRVRATRNPSGIVELNTQFWLTAPVQAPPS